MGDDLISIKLHNRISATGEGPGYLAELGKVNDSASFLQNLHSTWLVAVLTG